MSRLPVALLALAAFAISTTHAEKVAWPPLTKDVLPGTRWWWMGSAVNPADLTRELRTFREAGLGTVEITPIYGVKSAESEFIEFLSPKWMDLLKVAVTEARKLGMNADMVTGTGWCFGGPNVSDADANALAVYKDGVVTQRPSGVRVKRPAPGGAGWMLNLLCPDAMTRYLQRFTTAFAGYDGPKPHAQFHDSYEYKSDWSPDFFAQFEKRRGYRLQSELPALFEGKGGADHVARVKADYRQTVSELIEDSIARWTQWAHGEGAVAREQAHGSPGNWLDIYAAADVPETEMFYQDRNVLAAKFAASAAHVTGRNLVSSETGTWVAEHFTETLADLKDVFDDMFLAGVNRVMYHGTAYSPAGAPWPGWCFYASAEMNPRNAIWHDVPALNAYAARVQALLQSGRPDNDILLYWPLPDYWHNAEGLVEPLTIHGRDWFENQPIGRTADWLRNRGYAFDFISDQLLGNVKAADGEIDLAGNSYRAVLVPACDYLPLETLKKLAALAHAGIPVIFAEKVPHDVPGLADLKKRRAEFRKIAIRATPISQLDAALTQAGIRRESGLTSHAGVDFVRRKVAGGFLYFVANRGRRRFDGTMAIRKPAVQVAIMDPLSGRIGLADARTAADGTQVALQLEPDEALLLRTFDQSTAEAARWIYRRPVGTPAALKGTWEVKFLEGGPTLPKAFTTDSLGSWTKTGKDAENFAGTARYTLRFDAPAGGGGAWLLDLGRVCQSARVRLNGRDLGTVFVPPFRVPVEQLAAKNNILEVEVTSTSANRIRDLDRRGVKWKIFDDANVLNLQYKPFDASKWPVANAGLLGPVTLQPQS
jgi:hypothetical protein